MPEIEASAEPYDDARSTQRWLVKLFLASGLAIILWAIYAIWPYARRASYIDTVRNRGEPLIVAIERYVKDHGKAPPTLAELVPTYISAIPSTGYRPQSSFGYQSSATVREDPPGTPVKDVEEQALFAGREGSNADWWIWVNLGVMDLFADHDLTYHSGSGYWSGPDKGHTSLLRWPAREMMKDPWDGSRTFIFANLGELTVEKGPFHYSWLRYAASTSNAPHASYTELRITLPNSEVLVTDREVGDHELRIAGNVRKGRAFMLHMDGTVVAR